VRSDYEQAHLQHDVDEKLYKEGIASVNTKNLSKVKEDQLAIRLQLESERTKNLARLRKIAAVGQPVAGRPERQSTYGLRMSQSQSLRVRAGITGVLQLVPIEEGQNLPSALTWREWLILRS